MKRVVLLSVSAVVVLLGAVRLPARAQPAPPSPPPGVPRPILQATTTLTGQPLFFPLFRNQVASTLVELAAGGQTGPQRFETPAVVYVLDGTLTVEVEGQPARSFTTGQAFVPPFGLLANATNRGTGTIRFLTTVFGDARKPPLTRPAGSNPIGLRATGVLRTTKTTAGEDIVFPLLANQFLVFVADAPPGTVNPRHIHPHTHFVYVLAGDVNVEADGLPPRTFRPGEAFVEPLIPHIGANRSSTVARVLDIFVGEAGTRLTLPSPAP